MRRWSTAVAIGCVVVVAAAGCSRPAGVDGDLTDDWAAVSPPKPFLPEAGTCHPNFRDVGYLTSYQPTGCDNQHKAEIVYVGSFTGQAAARVSPPPAGSPARRAAFAECDAKASQFLGADWHSGRVQLKVVLPSDAAWSSASRWFRCDLAEVGGLEDDWVDPRTGSLKNALSAPSPLSHGCFLSRGGGVEFAHLVPVSCNKPHHSEFVGVWSAPDVTYADYDHDSKRIHRECRSMVARYAKVPDDGELGYRTGTFLYGPDEEQWAAGDRGVRCLLWLSNRDLTGSVKGAGTKGLPIRVR